MGQGCTLGVGSRIAVPACREEEVDHGAHART